MRRTCSLSNGGTFTVNTLGDDWPCEEFEILAEGLMVVAQKECPKIPGMPEGARITVTLSDHDCKEIPGLNFYHYRVSFVDIKSVSLFGGRIWNAECTCDCFKQMTFKPGDPFVDEISDNFPLSSSRSRHLYSHVFLVMREMLAVPFTLQDEKR